MACKAGSSYELALCRTSPPAPRTEHVWPWRCMGDPGSGPACLFCVCWKKRRKIRAPRTEQREMSSTRVLREREKSNRLPNGPTERGWLPLETEAAGLRLGPATVDLPLDLFEIPLKTMTVTPTQYYLLRGVFPDHRVSHGPPSPGSFFSQKELY